MKTEDYADLYALEESFWWFTGMRAITAALLDPLCPPARARRILDAGCGTGYNLAWLTRYAGTDGDVTGIDLASDALNFCRARGHARLTQASVTTLPFADASFDLVTSFDVLVQLPDAGADAQAVAEMTRVLRPAGIAFVRVAAYEWLKSGHDEALGTARRYTLTELRALLERAGLRVLRATYANSLLLPFVVAHRLALKPAGLTQRGSDVKPLPPRLQWLNALLEAALRREAHWLRHQRRMLPAGLSAICVAQKNSSQ